MWYIGNTMQCTAAYGGGATNSIALDYVSQETVAAGKTNTGHLTGIRATVYRSLHADDSTGVLDRMYTAWWRYGHFNVSENACVTNTVYGMYLAPVCHDGSIGTLYDLYIAGVAGAGTVTTHWGIYQVGATARNVFVGHSYFGGAAVAQEDVHAADTIRADVAFNLNGTDGLTGTLDVEVNGGRVQLGFTGGILTSQASPAATGTDGVSWS